MARRVLLLFAIGLTGLTLVAAGCGGDDEESASEDVPALTETTEEATEEEATEEETATEEEATEEEATEESSDSGTTSAEDCQEFAEATSEIAGAVSGTADLDELETTFEELTAAAPDEIKDDFEVLSDYVTQIAEVVGDGGTPSAEDAQALASLDSAAASTASQNIAAWATENCGAAATP